MCGRGPSVHFGLGIQVKTHPSHKRAEGVDYHVATIYAKMAQVACGLAATGFSHGTSGKTPKEIAPEARKLFAKAADHLGGFCNRHPKTSRKPAALYYAGDCFEKAGDGERSYQMFKRLIWDFPDSPWAKKARQRLRPRPHPEPVRR